MARLTSSHKRMDGRAQAAVTDALFLLVIISSLTGFLFLFSANYGKGISDQVNRNDSFEFVSSALKTIMYQSVPRDSTQTIDVQKPNFDQEVDYLMAQVKEDYADDQNLSDNTKRNLARSVYHVMRPIADNQDYLFSVSTAQKYVLMILWRTKFVIQTEIDPKTGLPKPTRFQNVMPDPTEPHEMFFCDPGIGDSSLQKLFLKVGATTQTQALINMVEFSSSSILNVLDTKNVHAAVLLSTWTATPIPDDEWALLQCEIPSINLTGIAPSPVAP